MFYTLMMINLFIVQIFDKVTFIANQRHFIVVDLDKINFDHDNNFDEDDPDTVIHRRTFGLGVVNLKNAKHLKKISEELMPIAWYPKRW